MAKKRFDTSDFSRRTFLGVAGGALSELWLSTHLLAQRASSGADSIVATTAGRVRGVVRDGVHVFKGIPYAAAPVGAARFQPPAPLKPWTAVRDAVAFGLRAPQPVRTMIPEIGDALVGSGTTGEDCLNLNIWTPGPRRGAARPVIVWFHGGGYRSGSANSAFYDGWALAKKQDAVFVSVNHRLSVLGFLYLAELGGEHYASSGNVGLLDLVAALRWVRDNIAEFGGDPGNVTAFGQSGGGGKVAMLMGLPAAKGLFQRAVIISTLVESGARGLSRPEATASAERFLARLDLKATQIDQLHRLPVERLIAALPGPSGVAGGTAPGSGPAGDISTQFYPVVDGGTLPTHPFDPVAPAQCADVPLICGSDETEGIPYGEPDNSYWTTEITTEAGLRDRVKALLRAGDSDADGLIALYRKRRPAATRDDIAAIITGDLSGSRQASYVIADRKFAQRRAPVYMYYFQWRSPVRGGRLRTMHSMDLPFIFDHVDDVAFLTGNGQDRYALAANMSAAFATFARTGKPGAAGLPEWKAYDPITRATMVFDVDPRLVNDPYGDERRALNAVRRPST